MSEQSIEVLLIDDDEDYFVLIQALLREIAAQQYRLKWVSTFEAGLQALLNPGADGKAYDVCLLDYNLGAHTGLELLKIVLEQGYQSPIIMLTARSDDADKVRGLNQGADDYLTKPFNPQELCARVAAILRRSSWYQASGAPLTFGGNSVDFKTYEARAWDGSEHSLTHKEAMILRVLADRPGHIVTREEILDRVRGYEVFPSTRTIDSSAA